MAEITFSGLASGIDGDAIIKSMSDSKRLATIPLQNQMEEAKQESDALKDLNEKLLELNDKLKSFMTLSGGSVRRQATSSNTEAVAAAASSNASGLSFSIDVHSLAKTAALTFEDRFTSFTTPIAPTLEGTKNITITVGEGSAAQVFEIPVTNTTTLEQLTSKINDISKGALLATTVNTGTTSNPSYALMINTTHQGLEKGSLSVNTAELAANAVLQNHNLTQASDAHMTVSGIGEVTRPSNQISDLFPGISLDLKQAGTGITQVSVAVDKEKSTEKVREIVDVLNSVIRFGKENSAIERVEGENGVTNVYGSLAKTRIDERVIESIRSSLFTSIASEANSAIKTYADLGITTARDGTLAFDEEKFQESLSKNPNAVNQILSSFADKTASVNGMLASFTRFDGQINLSIKSNANQVDSIQERMDRLERTIAEQEARLRLVFANLESNVSKLNSQSTALTSLIAGINQ